MSTSLRPYALAAVAAAALPSLAFAAAPEAASSFGFSPEAAEELLARVHPLLVHFPIALVIAAALAEFFGLFRRRAPDAEDGPRPVTATGFSCIMLAALVGGLAAWSGWTNAEFAHPAAIIDEETASTLFWHRWLGIGLASVIGVAFLCGLIAKMGSGRMPTSLYRLAVFTATGLAAVTGHFGGTLVYGPEYLTPDTVLAVFRAPEAEPAVVAAGPEIKPADPVPADPEPRPPAVDPAPVDPPAVEPKPVVDPEPAPVDPPVAEPEPVVDPEPAPKPVDPPVVDPTPVVEPTPAPALAATLVNFTTDILPILEARCANCHGPRRQRARLRLDSHEAIFDRAEPRWVVRPGDPADSEMLSRVSLPEDDEDRMPPGGERLTDEQVAAIERWIAEGAHASADAAEEARLAPPIVPVPVPEPKPAAPKPADPPADDGPSFEEDLAIALTPGLAARQEEQLTTLRDAGVWAGRLAESTQATQVRWPAGDVEVDLALIGGLERTLVWLDLSRTGVTDEALSALAGFRDLRRVRLGQTAAGDGAAEYLATLPMLRTLDLHGTAVTDAGLAKLAAGAPELRTLYLWGSKVTPAAAEAARKQRPDLTINLGAPAPAPEPEPKPDGDGA